MDCPVDSSPWDQMLMAQGSELKEVLRVWSGGENGLNKRDQILWTRFTATGLGIVGVEDLELMTWA